MSSIPWGELSRAREEVRSRWREVYDLPVVRKRFPFLASFLRPEGRLLEVGAAERPFDGRLKEAFPGLTHKTLDIDPSGRYDFQNLDEVAETFDAVVAWEVIEHLGIETIPGWLAELKRVTAPGGRVILSTPNVYRPGQYWKDATHKTPLAYTELGALLILAGFKVVSMHRTCHDSLLLLPLHGMVGTDPALSVAEVAEPAWSP